MKRIFLLLAAVAAFASCVKETDLVPDQPETQADNIVTLKATSSDTKAVLEGADVLWYGEEIVEVVLQKSGSPAYNIEFTANVAEASKNATFTGTISEVAKIDTELEETGWAVYPNTAVSDPWDGYLYYELDETQNGTDIAHISSARVNTADIQAGAANASFNNFLTLLKITVPEGVKEVSLTASYGIVGTAKLNKPNAEGKLSVNSYSSKKTVTLSTGSELDPEIVYSVLVFPGTAETLTLSMTGNDSNDVYESTLNNVELRPGTYRTIDLTEVFAMGVQAGAEIEISSVGGEKVISVADAAGYTYTVEESADWLEAAVLVTRSFSGKEIVLTAGANLTGSLRSAEVTISWSDQSRTFTVSQEGISSDYLEFVYDDPTDPMNSEPIQWSESFKIYANADDATAGDNILKERSGQFTIDFTEGEECEYGMYKITGLFFTDRYFSSTKGYMDDQGGIYYADYNPANKELTVYKDNAEKSYNITANVVLKYDNVNQSFSISDPVSFTENAISSEYNQSGVIYNYEATEYVAPDPGAGGGSSFDVTTLYGTYVESFTPIYSGYVSPETTVIGPSDNGSYDIKLQFFYTDGDNANNSDTVYGDVNADGTEISVYYTNSSYTGFNGTFTLTVSGNTLSGTLGEITDYTATKQGGVVDLSGTWNQTVVGMSWPAPSATMTITVDGSTVTLTDFVATGTVVITTFENNQIVIPAGTAIGSGLNAAGTLDADVVLTLEGNTFTAAPFSIGGYMNITSYSATNPNIE